MVEVHNSSIDRLKLVIGYQHDDILRTRFCDLSKRTFGVDFESWYQGGYWRDGYIPYSLFDGAKIVSNVSVSKMTFLYGGRMRNYLQIGTVMTDPDYRGRGLSGTLMKYVLEKYRAQYDLVFLYANKSVLNFYPKFGFERVYEYSYERSILVSKQEMRIKRVDLSDALQRKLFYNYLLSIHPSAGIAMINGRDLIMFYLMGPMQNMLYYAPDLDSYMVVDCDNNTLEIIDFFSKGKIDLDEVIGTMTSEKTDRVRLGFMPEDNTYYVADKIVDDDNALFVVGKDKTLFEDNRFHLPELAHT